MSHVPWFFRNKDINIPFGVMMPNGLNFSRAIHNPKSLLRRVLLLVHKSKTPLTKREILTILGYKIDEPMNHGWGDYLARSSNTFHANYFSGMVKAGFLSHFRKGNKVYWVKGDKFPNLDNLINV